MLMLIYSLLAASAVGLLSFVGALSLAIKADKLNKILIYLVSFYLPLWPPPPFWLASKIYFLLAFNWFPRNVGNLVCV